MRKLLWTVMALMVAYCGYWFIGSYGVLSGARAALAQIRAEGIGDFKDVSLVGFPSRFDVTVDGPMLRSSDGLLQWSAPFVQVLALSYQPNRVIAVWPHEQELVLGGVPLTLRSDDMRASATFSATPDVPLDHMRLVVTRGAFVSPKGWSAGFDALRLASLAGAAPNAHDIGFAVDKLRVSGLALPAPFGESPADVLVDATVQFDRPVDRHAQAIRVTSLSLHNGNVTWGGTQLTASGDLTVTASGMPEGRLALRAKGWRDLLHVLAQFGIIRSEVAPTVEKMLTQLEKLSPEAGTLNLPLVFSGGRMSLGPLPLGPAPRLSGYSQ